MRKLLENDGMPCGIVSGGSTSTYDMTGAIDGVDEVQAGSYALMDCAYRKLRPEFRCSMSILASVISSTGNSSVADVGLMLSILAGPDDRDPMSLPEQGLDFARAAPWFDVREL